MAVVHASIRHVHEKTYGSFVYDEMSSEALLKLSVRDDVARLRADANA